jgi:uncharacterized membrane protein YukC
MMADKKSGKSIMTGKKSSLKGFRGGAWYMAYDPTPAEHHEKRMKEEKAKREEEERKKRLKKSKTKKKRKKEDDFFMGLAY